MVPPQRRLADALLSASLSRAGFIKATTIMTTPETLAGDDRLIGVISERNLLRFLTQHPQSDQTTVDEVMQSQPIAVRPDTPLSVAVTTRLEHRINCLPVVDEAGCVCGIVTSTDLLRTLQQMLD